MTGPGGDGVFETMLVTRSRPFAVTRHLLRLARSAAGLGLTCPPAAEIRAAIDAVLRAGGVDEGRLRVTVGSGRPRLVVTAGALPAWPPDVDVVIAPWPWNEHGALAGIKSTSYGDNAVALAHARAHGAGEALFANLAGNLCEGAGTNLFVGIGGRLVTPPRSAGCLAGVTRELVQELVDVVEDDLPLAALAGAREAFLTSSTRGVHPVRAVDGTALPACPGPLTVAASAAYAALVAGNLDP